MSSEAPGWAAIDAALRGLYGEQEPRHVAYMPGLALGSGLQGCSAYRGNGYWHYVSYGLTELWQKEEGGDPDVSGWGYELTMRVRQGGEDDAPGWPFDLLEKLARHTQTQDQPFWVGDRPDLAGPITGSTDSRLVAVAVVVDPELGAVASPNGSFEFRQVVGITADELEEMRATSTDQVLQRLATGNPLLVTDPAR